MLWQRDRTWGALVGVLALAYLAVGVGGGSHFDSDDTLYAQMAREMVQSGDWVDNRWSDTVLFEKPPLYLWSLAVVGSAFGWDEWAMRLPNTLFAVAALLGLFVLGRGLDLPRRPVLLAVGLMAGSFLFLLMARRLMTDIPLVACLVWAAAALAHGRTRLFGVACGLAVLAKGPAAAPLVLALVIFGLVDRGLTLRSLAIAAGIGLAVAAPWHILVTARHGGEFWSGYVGYHVGARATSSVVPGRTLVQMLEVALLERVLLAMGLAGLGLALARGLKARCDRLAVLWLAFTWIPVLVSTTRLPHYLLPMVPALALLAVRPIPTQWWEHRLAGLVGPAVVLLAFAAHPSKLAFWLDPDFGPTEQLLGEEIADAAGDDDLVATYNGTTAALTFYSGGRRIVMYTDDPRFHEVMDGVLMVRRAGVLHALSPTEGIRAEKPLGRRFIVARAEPDLPGLVYRMRRGRPDRPLYLSRAGGLVLVNDAGLGEPLP